MQTPAALTGVIVDLTNCDKEPIHIPGSIQPHGVLFVLREPGLKITCVSESSAAMLGLAPSELLGRDLTELLEPSQGAGLAQTLQGPDLRAINPLKLTLTTAGEQRFFDAIAHRHKGHLLLELEPSEARANIPFLSFFHQTRGAISKLRSSRDLSELCTHAAQEVRRLTGFDRVLVYMFDPEWNGRVIAEDKREGTASYLGLNFPASDIPRQARELYASNWLRFIPTIHYQPSRLVSADPGAEPIDLSFSALRSVSPIHLEYLKNMGATASMSVSLMKESKLWGLISCTHEAGPRLLPYEVRAACEFLGEITSSLLGAKEANEDLDYKIRLKSVQTALLQSMAQQKDFIRSLMDSTPSLLDLTGAKGAAVYFNQRTYVIGAAPDEKQLSELIQWLAQQPAQELFVTESLPKQYPPAEAFKDVACGVMAGPLSRGQHNYVLWFRPEVVQTVNWSGNPNKPVEVDGDVVRLHPRKSFELWKETVHLRSLPWKAAECEAASELMKSIVDLVLQKSEELAKLNTELERSNVELDAFAYAASHDLKEPLRGIHNYTSLVMRELGDEHLIGESRARMNTVVKLTQRMEDLINSLLHYSHVGRMDLSMREVDLNDMVAHVQEMLKVRLEETQTVLRVPRRLPVVRGDRVLLGEVFSNLITNSVKYNDKPERWIEVGYLDRTADAPLTLYVRDNGIGIRDKNLDTVFKIFRRLHAREKYGGGTGTGLTIAKRIIERHGGRIWVESTLGEGTTFFFTLEEGARRGD